MKERKNAQQAYKSAMDELKMPAQLETDRTIMMSGSGGIKMKSKALAFAAAAAVLAVFVGVGAFVLSRTNNDDIKTASSSQLADKAQNSQDEKNESYPLNVKLVSARADAHGIIVKLTAKPNSEQGAELIRKYGTKDQTGHCELMLGSEKCDDLEPIYLIGSDGTYYTKANQYNLVIDSSAEKGEEYINYICYIPLKDTPPEDLPFDIYLKARSDDMTDEDTQNGKWKNVTVGKITVKYKRNADEKVYTAPSGRKIYLSDLYFTVPVYSDTGEFTLKYSDGTTKQINNKELWIDYTDFNIENPYEDSKAVIKTSDNDINPNFFKDEINTADVTSIFYAGEEYKLADNSEYKSAKEASQAFEQAYNSQLEILNKYKTESDRLSKDSITKMCEQYDEYLDTICKTAKTAAGKDVIVLARKTAGSELILYIWSEADPKFPDRSILGDVCEICDNDKTLFTGKAYSDFVTWKDSANYGRFYFVTVDCTGADMGLLKKAKEYHINFHITNGTEYTAAFTLTTDEAELSVKDRNTLYAKMTQSVGYKAFTSQN